MIRKLIKEDQLSVLTHLFQTSSNTILNIGAVKIINRRDVGISTKMSKVK